MLIKNHPSKGLILRIIQKLILDGIAGVKFLLEGKPNHTFAILKAHISVYVNLGEFLKIRKQLKDDFGDKQVTMVYPRLIIWDYYMKRKKKYTQLNID